MNITKPDFRRLETSGQKLDAAIAAGRTGQAACAKTGGFVREPAVVLVRGSDLTPEPIEWLWPQWLALGKLHVLAGAPGQGKTTIALAFAAAITSGKQWPDGTNCSPGTVLIWSGEDDPADTLLPRLIAAGADRSRVYFVKGARVGDEVLPFDPARDLVQLTAAAERIGNVRMLIVDPVVSAVAGDSNKSSDVRRALQPLVDLAANLRAAVLGISHFTKGSAGKDPTERVTGSVAFSAVARVVLVAARVKDDKGDDRRIFARSKSNIGPDDGGFEYSLTQVVALPGIEASRVDWGSALPGTAQELLREAEADSGSEEETSALDEACEFLASELRDGPQAAKYLLAEARHAGHAERTLKRAKARLGVESRKEAGSWQWSAIDANKVKGANKAKSATSQTLGTVGSLKSRGDDVEAF